MKIALTILSIFSVVLFLTYESAKINKITHGFASYYTFSKLVLEENDFSRAYDTTYFNSKIHDFGIEGIRDLPNNIPTSTFLFLAIAPLPPIEAKIAWTILNFLFYIASVILLTKILELKLKEIPALILITVSFLFYPVYIAINLGQAYVFLLLLFTISMCGLKKENDIMIAIPISLMLVLKGYGIFPLAALGALKKWKAFYITIFISFFFILITLPVVGIKSWNQYFSEGLNQIAFNKYAAFTAYQTLKSLFLNISPEYSNIILILTVILTLIFFIRKIPLDKTSELHFYSSVLLLNVIFAPVAEDYHYTLALPAIFCAGKIIIENYGHPSVRDKSLTLEAVLFIVSIVLFSVPFNYKSFNETGFPLILLAYPRLYAALIQVILCFRLISFNKLSKTLNFAPTNS